VGPGLTLDHSSSPPGGPVTATGHGCDPASRVNLSIDATPSGTTVADAEGAFSAPILASVGVGQHTVSATCGPTLQAVLDVVLTSHAGPPTSTAAILLILLLVVIAVSRWQLFNR
jgi:hypothetical protein